MKKRKIISCIFLGIFAIVVVFLATVFIVNKIKLSKEKDLLANNPGRFVEINGHNMCIYEACKKINENARWFVRIPHVFFGS